MKRKRNAGQMFVDSAECTKEWEGLKWLFVDNFSHMSMRQMTNLLCTDASLQDLYPQLLKPALIPTFISVSTAECERSFSTMNCLKTKLRNRMNTLTLDRLIHISMEGPPLHQFSFERTANIWATCTLRNKRLQVGVPNFETLTLVPSHFTITFSMQHTCTVSHV